ncbi:MAG: DUF2834 domain-containing protein [Stenotrophobium sp.]
MTRSLLILVILAFGALSTLALEQHGYWGIIAYHLPSSAGWQVGADLVIACTLACIWMIGDARKSGRNVWPYLLITLVMGSFGPLFYLLIGSFRKSASRPVLA